MAEMIYYDTSVIGSGLGELFNEAGFVQMEAEMDSLAVVIPNCQVICTENIFTASS